MGEHEISTKEQRNPVFHRKFFSMIDTCFQNQEKFDNLEDLRAYLIMKAGFHRSIETDKGLMILPKSISFEKMDIRDFTRQRRFDLVTSDVSFISLHHILESVDALSKKWIILLFKPQFEVGKDVKRDSNGVVVDEKAIERSRVAFEEATAALGWKMVHHEPSTLSGKEGNIEECYCFEKC